MMGLLMRLTDMDIIAHQIKDKAGHGVQLRLGNQALLLKFDTGAKNTVISVDAIYGKLSVETIDRLKTKLEKAAIIPKEFDSATGDTFWGYLVSARNVRIGQTVFSEFYYYLVLENKRTVALLGEDFIDNADYSHVKHEDIHITDFDSESYRQSFENAVEETDIISAIEEKN